MIRVELTVDTAGCFVSCKASGHAGAGVYGNDPVCAAVSAILRTVMEQLSENSDIVLSSDAKKRGELCFSVSGDFKKAHAFLSYAESFLVTGIGSVSRDFPECVTLQVQTV